MPIVMNSPGVYVTELPSSQHPIVGVATSITAFVGSAMQGPVGSPRTCNTWTDFVRTFGGLLALQHDVLRRLPVLPERREHRVSWSG